MERTPLDPWIAAKIGRPLTRGAIAAYQVARLRDTVALAARQSPFYRRRLGPVPPAITGPADLGKLPFTTAADIAANPLLLLCVSQDEINRVVTLTTSGTTGAAKRLYFTAADQELTRDFFHHGMATLVEPGDRVLILMPGEVPGSVGDLLREALARLPAEGIPHGFVGDPARTMEIIHRERIDSLVGIPTQVLALARWRPQGTRPPLKTVLLTTDHVPRAVTAELERLWQVRVFNHYGMTEMGLGGGVECAAQSGYHLREADLWFEIVDPLTGMALPEGAEGEIVFTTLTRQGMPLIRYRTGDLGRFLPGACPCGTILRRLARVEDRVRGRIPLSGGGFLSMAMLDEVLFRVEGVLDFQAEVTLKAGGDLLTLTVQAAGWAGPAVGEAAVRSLWTIPTVAEKVAGGSLRLALAGVEYPRELARPGKRMIRDRRAGEGDAENRLDNM